MNFAKLLLPALAAFALSTSMASANPGMTTASVNMRMGPGTQHPVIVAIPGNQPVTIVGCISGAAWCDVVWASYRGWVSAGYIHYYTTPTSPVPVTTVYQQLPVVAPWADARRDARVQSIAWSAGTAGWATSSPTVGKVLRRLLVECAAPGEGVDRLGSDGDA